MDVRGLVAPVDIRMGPLRMGCEKGRREALEGQLVLKAL